MTTTEFLLIRHGESTWNAEGRWQGQDDPPLSRRGRWQARLLAHRLAGERPLALVSSDLSRARETAAPLAEAFGLALDLEPRLRELDVGSWSGLRHDEIAARWPEELARLRAGDWDVRCGGAESRRALHARALAALGELAERHPARRVAVVTHGGVVRTLLEGVRLENAQWCRADWTTLRAPRVRAR